MSRRGVLAVGRWRRALAPWLVALALCLSGAAGAWAKAPPPSDEAQEGLDAFSPDRTWAVIAGVLTWPDASLSSFSAAGRKDQELRDTLLERGVPGDQVTLLLDEAATAAAILGAVERAAKAAGPGDTLIVYYAGHGLKRPDGSFVFASYDTATRDLGGTGLHLSALQARLEAHFKGGRVWLMADCCYSGGLGEVADALAKKGIQAFSLSSSEASNVSTVNWTFTQAIVDGLRGSDLCDGDGDGRVTIDELVGEAREALMYREQQRAGWRNPSPGVPDEWLVASSQRGWRERAKGGRWQRGDWVMAPRGGSTAVARVLRRTAEGYVVAFYDYHQRVEATVAERELSAVEWERYETGARVLVSWYGRPYEARILEAEAPFYRVTYPGWASSWDEWVGPRRIVGRLPSEGGGKDATKANAGARPKAGASKPAPFPLGAQVQVEWRGRWWPARVKGTRGERVCVHYLGYGERWDECVVPSRVKAAEGAAGAAPRQGGETAQRKALVEWKGQWYPAVVLATKGEVGGDASAETQWKIRYVGYDASWDEWVGRDRIRFPEQEAPAR